MRKKLWGGVGVFAFVGCLVLFGSGWTKVPLTSAPANLDLTAPDALIRSKGLSRLPADLLRVPLLHDLLTEDFLFYYENSDGRLGLKGTLRRIAYEHDVTLTDKVISMVLDEPADVALWRGQDGSLAYYAISLTRGKLAKLLEPAAKIALKDRQLAMVGEVRVEGQTIPLFALEYAWKRKLLLASRGDRVAIFSDPGMLLTENGDLTPGGSALLADLLSADKARQQRFATAFSLDNSERDHTIAVKTGFLSFSYQHFFRSFKALRFDFSGKGGAWSTSALLDAAQAQAGLFDAHALWSSLPGKPSACAALPMDWLALAKAMNSQAVINADAANLAAQFRGPAAVCWYSNSRLHTPLFVTQMSAAEGVDRVLEAYFNYGIKAAKPKENDQPVHKIVAAKNKAGDAIWQPPAGEGLRPTLARNGKLVYFSPDAALVEQALAVSHKRAPALSDSWRQPGAAENAVAILGPANIAVLAQHEVEQSLPQQQDPALRGAADRYLLPKLASIKKYPPMRLALHSAPKGAGWVALDWQPY